MAEGARLESVCTVFRTAGSNPALSVALLTLKQAGREHVRRFNRKFNKLKIN